MKKTTYVLSVGGSLIVPQGGIDTRFLNELKKLIAKFVKKGYRFVIVTGGGGTARQYIGAAKKIGGLTEEDLDWLGTHATRINAHLVRTIFRDIAHPVVIKDPSKPLKKRWTEPVLVAGGWKPGRSTDYIATRVAKRIGATEVVNLSNIDMLYDKDPKKYKSAKPVRSMSWKEYRAMVGDDWDPGMNVPFDPVASKLADRSGIRVSIVGRGMKNLEKFLTGKEFNGSVIE